MWVKKGNPYLLIKTMNIKRFPTRLKLAYSQGPCKRHGWVTHARIDENPAIRGHDLCFDKTWQWQPRLETWSGRRKTVRNYDRTDVMSCCKKLSAD